MNFKLSEAQNFTYILYAHHLNKTATQNVTAVWFADLTDMGQGTAVAARQYPR